jgi:hypothetical protein
MTGVGANNDANNTPRVPAGRGPMAMAMMLVNALIGIAGLALIILGFAFWAGKWTDLVPMHEKIGIVVVLLLWVVALIGLAYNVSKARIAIAIVWGFIVIGFGFAQTGIMVGDMHWVIRVLHLIVGLVALSLAGTIARGISDTARARQ